MRIQHEYLQNLMERVEARNPAEPEFLQAVGEDTAFQLRLFSRLLLPFVAVVLHSL